MTTVPQPKTEPHAAAFACYANDSLYPGLTKREYFAAFIVQGLLSQHVATRAENEKPSGFQSEPVYKAPFKNSMHWDEVEELARGAVIIADALIAQLNNHSQK